MSEATWKRRFSAPVVMFPTWSRERPERLLYLSNAKQVAMEIAFVAKHLGTTPPLA